MKRFACWIGLLAFATAIASGMTGSRAGAAELGPGSTYSLSSYLPDGEAVPPPPGIRNPARTSPLPPLPPPLTGEPLDAPAGPAGPALSGSPSNGVPGQPAGELGPRVLLPALDDHRRGHRLDPHRARVKHVAHQRRRRRAVRSKRLQFGMRTPDREIDVVRHFDGWDIEVLYFGIDSWNDSQSFAAAGMVNTLVPGANPLKPRPISPTPRGCTTWSPTASWRLLPASTCWPASAGSSWMKG